MEEGLDRIMSTIKDYKTGYGGVTDSLIRKELVTFAKDYHTEQCNTADVVGRSEQLKAFIDFYNSRQNREKRICYDEIEVYIESL